MLVVDSESSEHHIVMAVIFDKEENRQIFVYSVYGNASGQYRHDAKGHTIIDDTIPEYWTTGYGEVEKIQVMTFPEWAGDPGKPGVLGFYERYVNGEPDAVQIFEKYFEVEKRKYAHDSNIARDMQA